MCALTDISPSVLCLCTAFVGKLKSQPIVPGNRSNGFDIYIRAVTHGHLFSLPFKRYCFQRLIFGFFSCGLLLLDEVGGSLGKDFAVAHGVAPAQPDAPGQTDRQR